MPELKQFGLINREAEKLILEKSDLKVRLIKTPEPEVIAAVATLEAQAFGRGGLNEWHLPVIARYGRLYVLESGTRILAAASLIKGWTVRGAYLIDLVVERELRGQGCGRLLMEQVVDRLKKEDISFLELTVAKDNISAINLYHLLGFEKTDTRLNEYGPGHDRLAMSVKI